jgi:hypothetical protein
MATVFIPMIAQADYDSFRRVLNRDLPDAYDKWLQCAAKMSEDNGSKGGISKLVQVNPGEFTRGADANLHSLGNFAYEKGMGHRY